MPFEGINPSLVTPFKQDYSLDGEGFANLIEHLIGCGVHALTCGGTTGEYYAQTRQERIEIIRLAKDVIQGRVPLIAGVGAIRIEEAMEIAAAAREIGADALLLGAPYYAMPNEKQLAWHCLRVAESASLPIMLYHLPQRTAATMGRDFLDMIGKNKNICAIKECSDSLEYIQMLVADYSHIQLVCGMDDQALEFFAWGATSWCSAGANILPKELVAFYEAFVIEKNLEKARHIAIIINPLMKLMERGGDFLPSIKYALTSLGLPSGPPCFPLGKLEAEKQPQIDAMLQTVKNGFSVFEEKNL